MAIYNVNKTSSPTITQTATRSGGVMRAGGLNLSSLISALAGMSDNQKNRCDIIINDTYSLTQYDSTTYTNSSIQSNGSVISYILDTTTPEFKSRVGSTDTPINVTSWKIIYADDSISGGNSYPANRVTYDNAGTDLTSTTVQGAITEIINGGTENIFDGSIEDWNALSTAEKIAYDHAMINNDYSDNPVGNLNALTTTDKSSCVGAINEVNGGVIASVTADGVKTYSALFDELYALLSNATILYPNRLKITLFGGTFQVSSNNQFYRTYTQNDGTISTLAIMLNASGSTYRQISVNTSGTSSYMSLDSNVVSNGTVISVIY